MIIVTELLVEEGYEIGGPSFPFNAILRPLLFHQKIEGQIVSAKNLLIYPEPSVFHGDNALMLRFSIIKMIHMPSESFLLRNFKQMEGYLPLQKTFAQLWPLLMDINGPEESQNHSFFFSFQSFCYYSMQRH